MATFISQREPKAIYDDGEEDPSFDPPGLSIDDGSPGPGCRFAHGSRLLDLAWRTSALLKYPKSRMGIFLLVLCTVAVLAFQSTVLEHREVAKDSRPRKAVILASHWAQNTTWVDYAPDDWEVYKYVMDDPNATLTTPRGDRREPMAYLTFIVDHYDNLPDYMVFIHGEEKSWHQPEPMGMLLRALSLPLVGKFGWVSLRCILQNTCEPGNSVKPNIINFWLPVIMEKYYRYVFRPEDPWFEPLPEELATPCCAQFAVSKELTLRRPLAYWKRLRQPLLLETEVLEKWYPEMDELAWRVGGMFEVSWQWLFGAGATVCLDKEYCQNEVFGGKIRCDGETWSLPDIEWYKNITCAFDETAKFETPDKLFSLGEETS